MSGGNHKKCNEVKGDNCGDEVKGYIDVAKWNEGKIMVIC
jgi:hypothetical protein